MKRLNLLLISSALLLGIPSLTTLSSCGSTNTNKADTSTKVTLTKGDSVNLNKLAVEKGIDLTDVSKNYNISYTTSSSKIVKVTKEGNAISKAVGNATVSVNDTNSGNTLLQVEIEVVGYEEYSDVKAYTGKGSFGGYFIDLNVGSELARGKTYGVTYSNDNLTDQSLSAVISNPEIISWVDNDGQYSITANGIGNSKLELYDCNNDLVFRNVIKVRRPFESSEEVIDYLSGVDYFTASGYGEGVYDGNESKTTKLVFNSDGTGSYYGVSQEAGGDIGNNTFTLEFDEFYTTYQTFRFNVNNFTKSDSYNLDYTVKTLDVTETGDQIRLYSSIILDIYFPRSNK